ncbi:hypothetical protein GALMADRAFT_243320 [Galerina marginata CBS 339.88]|uniref:Uncharacterized protein n=1 Tax=Galerina marginata (strain CBS 339.88) TaxID=685588 RepID=A0A067TK25_GALM3|nr:hypothetical protein GALMADRAFT_243320 [Galerina marginata CBS 339.88]
MSSFIARVEEFFVTGFISLAIVLATIRAYVARLSVYFEWAGFSGVFIIFLFLTLGVYLYFLMKWCCRSRQRSDEEDGTIEELHLSHGGQFRVMPILLDSPRLGDLYGGLERNCIRLEDSDSLGEHIQFCWVMA